MLINVIICLSSVGSQPQTKNSLVTNNQVNIVESVANLLLSDKERAESCHRTEKFDEFYVSSVDLIQRYY